MSASVQLTVASTTESMRLDVIAPHLETWRGMRREGKALDAWRFERASITLTYEGRLGGAGLFNTVRVQAMNPTDGELSRLMEFAEWLRTEPGWERTDVIG